jgi:hypothetical protein
MNFDATVHSTRYLDYLLLAILAIRLCYND